MWATHSWSGSKSGESEGLPGPVDQYPPAHWVRNYTTNPFTLVSILTSAPTKVTCRTNVFTNQQIHQTLNPHDTGNPVLVFPPFVSAVFNHISRVLTGHNMNSRTHSSFHQPMKNDLGLKTPGICSIPCHCGKAYISQKGHFY
jgi:hypothetical protein